tara:strand:+ start:519 stop:905 length:387 start_codon:yes stop_codon:yes gene_type:complete
MSKKTQSSEIDEKTKERINRLWKKEENIDKLKGCSLGERVGNTLIDNFSKKYKEKISKKFISKECKEKRKLLDKHYEERGQIKRLLESTPPCINNKDREECANKILRKPQKGGKKNYKFHSVYGNLRY